MGCGAAAVKAHSRHSEKHKLFGSRKHTVPLILCNYDGFYSGLIGLLKAFDMNGTLAAPELKDVMLASSNEEACHLEFLLPSSLSQYTVLIY